MIIAFVVLVFVSLTVAVLPSGGDPGPALGENTLPDIEIVASATDTGGAQPPAVAIPTAQEGASLSALARPSAPESAPESAAAASDSAQAAAAAAASDSAQSTAAAAASDSAQKAAQAAAASDSAQAAAAAGGRNRAGRRGGGDDVVYDGHSFVEHVTEKFEFGADMLEPGQETFGGYTVSEDGNTITGQSPITGLRPVIEQAIRDVAIQFAAVAGSDSFVGPGSPQERAIARRLTLLNDWDDLDKITQDQIISLSGGIRFDQMTEEQQESEINHLLHSPLPFGDIVDEVLSPDVIIDLGYTHTLDKSFTLVENLGEGIFEITMLSNNNNGSHTGHNLGRFKVQLTPETTLEAALDIGNAMVRNENNNQQLLLADAAKRILYGDTPLLDIL